MANELNMTVTLTYTPTDSAGEQVKVAPPAFSNTVTMTGDDHTQGTQTIAAAEEAVLISADIGTTGYVLIKNTGSANAVEIGGVQVSAPQDAMPLSLKAGEFCLFRASEAIYAFSTTGTTVQYWIFED